MVAKSIETRLEIDALRFSIDTWERRRVAAEEHLAKLRERLIALESSETNIVRALQEGDRFIE